MKTVFFLSVLSSSLLFTGCGEAEQTQGPSGKDGYNSLVKINEEPIGDNCEFGGKSISTGIDTNNNTILEEDEVVSKEYLCNATNGLDGSDGEHGEDGSDGEDGLDGTNGTTALILSEVLPVGSSQCANGGFLYKLGLDSNNNNQLDESEIISTQYLCNGLNGNDGADSAVKIVTIVQLETGDSICPSGGQLYTSGYDLNVNNQLDEVEITERNYICSDEDNTTTPTSPIKHSSTLELHQVSQKIFSDATDADKTAAENALELKLAVLAANDADMQAFVQSLKDSGQTDAEIIAAIANEMVNGETAVNGSSNRSALLDKIKSGLIDVMDSDLGGKIIGAAFDVVLNSEGVTVVMLDAARGSRTITQVMIDAIDRNMDLLTKMRPMLESNKEFGEKFAALAYEMYPETKEGAPDMGNFFFFSIVTGPLYSSLTDAMLLSNVEANHHESVEHSTTGYIGLLMERYAKDFFIKPGTGVNSISGYGKTDAFSSLMFDTGVNVDYNSTTNTFTGHGDANELANEQLFYAMFKTPGSTNSFVAAMEQLDVPTRTMFMDKIFMGLEEGKERDTVQGYLNVISIGASMYDGIYGEKDAETGVRGNAYGFGAYTKGLIDLAKIIPSDKYMTYGKAFMDAGYTYALYNGIDIWSGINEETQNAWNGHKATAILSSSRSAGLGLIGSDWLDDYTDLFIAGWGNISLTDVYDAAFDENSSIIGEINAQANVAYQTVLDGRNEVNETVYSTVLSNGTHIDQTVYGFHGLMELAMQEDLYAYKCSNRPFTAAGDIYTATCENNESYTMDNAKETIVLPPFSQITWEYAYGSAKEGVVNYWNNDVDAQWLADLSDQELVKEYFYPDANNSYIPNWLMGINWLKAPANVGQSNYETIDWSFDAGYMDIYVVSDNADLIDQFDLAQTAAPVKTITMEKVEMGSDAIIIVDANGQLDGRYVYKVRVVSPKDTEAALAYLNGLVDSTKNLVGIDATNVAKTLVTHED